MLGSGWSLLLFSSAQAWEIGSKSPNWLLFHQFLAQLTAMPNWLSWHCDTLQRNNSITFQFLKHGQIKEQKKKCASPNQPVPYSDAWLPTAFITHHQDVEKEQMRKCIREARFHFRCRRGGEGSSSNQLIERRQLPLQFLWLRYQIICSCCGKWGGLIREEGGVHLPYLYFAHIPLLSTFFCGGGELSVPLPRHCFHLFYMQQEWQVGVYDCTCFPIQFFRLSKWTKVEGRREREGSFWHICRSFRERILLSCQRPVTNTP